MVKPKPKTKGSLQSVADTPSDSKQSDSSKHSSSEAEDSPAPVAATTAPTTEDTLRCTQAIAEPSAKKTKLQQQLKIVEKQVHCDLSPLKQPKLWHWHVDLSCSTACIQIFDLETSLVSSSERPYSVFKGDNNDESS